MLHYLLDVRKIVIKWLLIELLQHCSYFLLLNFLFCFFENYKRYNIEKIWKTICYYEVIIFHLNDFFYFRRIFSKVFLFYDLAVERLWRGITSLNFICNFFEVTVSMDVFLFFLYYSALCCLFYNKTFNSNLELLRKIKKLDSLLGDNEEIRKKGINVQLRLTLNDSPVNLVLFYNFGTLGIAKRRDKKLDFFYRKHLKRVLG